MNVRTLCALSLAWVGLLVLPVPVEAGRPLAVEDAETVGKGKTELELGLDHARQESGDRETTLSGVLTYGLTERLDLALEVPILFMRPEEGGDEAGLGDVELHGKVRFLAEGDAWPALALVGAVKFSTGSERRGLGSGATDGGVTLVATKGLGPVTAHANLGYTVIGASGADDVVSYGLAAEVAVLKPLSLVGELVGETNSDPEAKADPLDLRVGLTYALRETITVDGAVSIGLTRASPDYVLTVGVTIRF